MDLRDTRFSFVPAEFKRGICNRLRFASNSYAMLKTSKTKGSKGKRQRRNQGLYACRDSLSQQKYRPSIG